MILGCCYGEMYTIICQKLKLFDDSALGEVQDARKNFYVIAIAASLGGYTRMTYSLAVIMMETSQTMNLFVPIFLTILISNVVGSIFTRGLYDRAVRGK